MSTCALYRIGTAYPSGACCSIFTFQICNFLADIRVFSSLFFLTFDPGNIYLASSLRTSRWLKRKKVDDYGYIRMVVILENAELYFKSKLIIVYVIMYFD